MRISVKGENMTKLKLPVFYLFVIKIDRNFRDAVFALKSTYTPKISNFPGIFSILKIFLGNCNTRQILKSKISVSNEAIVSKIILRNLPIKKY